MLHITKGMFKNLSKINVLYRALIMMFLQDILVIDTYFSLSLSCKTRFLCTISRHFLLNFSFYLSAKLTQNKLYKKRVNNK